ncbi:hypothetical protein SAMN02745866_01636 [Alteromonadaceae bacterium Bs31]|nr:hypothetical protein SAMN02745866_01636 [Alteromonadaceae bacterium Bs31]
MFQRICYVASLLALLLAPLSFGSDYYQKPGAPVRLADLSAIELQPGELTTVTIAFVVGNDVQQLDIYLHPSKDLRIVSSQNYWTFTGPELSARVELQVEAPRAGDYPLMFSAVSLQGDVSMSRVLGARVSVPSPQPLAARAAAEKIAPQESAKTLSDGRRIHWVPAQPPR